MSRKPGYSLLLGLLALAPGSWAETLNVATWSFASAPDTNATSEARLHEAATVLKKRHPDVILLENARDWQTCRALVKALKPENYSVLVCSAFPSGAGATNAPPQVAVLSRLKGYFSWSEPWQGESEPALPGGFAFAAVHCGKHRVGFFVAHLEPQTLGTNGSHAALSRQWARTLKTFESWEHNRLEAVVVDGGDLAPNSEAGKQAARFLGVPLQHRVRLPAHPHQPGTAHGLVPVDLAADVKTVPGLILMGSHIACALNLDAPKPPRAETAEPKPPPTPKPPKAADASPEAVPLAERAVLSAPAKVESVQGGSVPSRQSRVEDGAPGRSGLPLEQWLRFYLPLAAACLSLLAVAGLWLRRRRARAAARALVLPGNPVSSYTLVLSEHSIASPTMAAGLQPQIPQRVPPQPASETAPSPAEAWPPGPVLLSPELERATIHEREGLRAQLAQFLGLKLVQRLLADRSELLKTQHAATGRLLSLEERLAKLELQLQQQNQAYEQRIGELNRELGAAKEENRELIRARIAQVKAEMESARARLLAQARAGER